jgi:hypothetical protein
MKSWLFESGPLARRARRSLREIVLAVLLTLAALGFVIAAIGAIEPETAAVDDRGKATSKQN